MTARTAAIIGGLVGLAICFAVLSLMWFGVAGVLNVSGTDLMYVFWPFSVMLKVGWNTSLYGVITTLILVGLNSVTYSLVAMLLWVGCNRIITFRKSLNSHNPTSG